MLDASAGPATPQTSSSPSPSARAEPVELPAREPDTQTLLQASGAGSSAQTWPIEVQAGAVWVAVNCLGKGQVQVSAQPAVDITIPCDAASITPSLNEINVGKAQSWTVKFTASAPVVWAARVSQ
ncbi:hypothetical protein LWF15_15825 [Kineosporia rhizophila]|uniref:hypothetical protein n=1 Tax=Kineosporia TaxID=49184 RepID=UPI001E413B37|nr:MULTISPECIES: hypothetical protein [Kineosporia]MCE0536971.1 hypothetical protein [Kineosporia rhizophila]